MPSEPSPAPVRDATIDIAKGLAISMVVTAHVWRALMNAGVLDPRLPAVGYIDVVLGPAAIGVFAFAAGLFVASGMHRDGVWPYARDRLVTFAWLYLLWQTLQLSTKLAMGSTVNNPVAAIDLLTVWIPREQFWFFGWIGFMTVLTAILRPWSSRSRGALTLTASIAVSLLLWGVNFSLLGTQGLALTAFYVLGVVITGRRLLGVIARTRTWTALAIAALAGSCWLWLSDLPGMIPATVDIAIEDRTPAGIAVGFGAGLCAIAALLALSLLLARVPRLGDVLAIVGRQSLMIYVAHVFFSACARIALVTLGVTDATVQLIVDTLAGIAGPIALAILADRLRFGWIHSAPRFLQTLRRTPGEAAPAR